MRPVRGQFESCGVGRRKDKRLNIKIWSVNMVSHGRSSGPGQHLATACALADLKANYVK